MMIFDFPSGRFDWFDFTRIRPIATLATTTFALANPDTITFLHAIWSLPAALRYGIWLPGISGQRVESFYSRPLRIGVRLDRGWKIDDIRDCWLCVRYAGDTGVLCAALLAHDVMLRSLYEFWKN